MQSWATFICITKQPCLLMKYFSRTTIQIWCDSLVCLALRPTSKTPSMNILLMVIHWRLRLTKVMHPYDERRVFASPFDDFDATFKLRQREADEFYTALQPVHLDEDQRRVHRQALAGMLWNKQFYHYIVEQWLQGDQAQPQPPH